MTPYTSVKIRIISFTAIIAVVFLHAYNLDMAGPDVVLFPKTPLWALEQFISYGLTRVAVPLFFAVSGYFFFSGRGTLREKIRKRFRTVFLPFLIWSLLGIALYFILQSIPASAKFFTRELVRDYSWMTFLDKVFIHPIPYQLWFLRDLMVLVICSPVMLLLIKKIPIPLLIVLFAIWWMDFDAIRNSDEAVLFFVAGGCVAMHRPDWPERPVKNAGLFLMLWPMLLALKIVLMYHEAATFWITSCHKAAILLGLLSVWGGFDVLFRGRENPPKWMPLTALTFFVFAAHEPLLTVVKKSLLAVAGGSQTAFLTVYLAAPLMAISGCLIAGAWLRRYLPALYGALSGGR
jgi:fucose 4-O-acetylase-like acetyltransferase